MSINYSIKWGQGISLSLFSFLRWLCCLLLIGFVETVHAQDSPKQVNIYLKDKTKIVGRILRIDKWNVVLLTEKSDTINIPQKELLGMELVGTKLSLLNKSNFDYKYFLSPSAIPVENRTWHYSNQDIFYHSIHYGVNKKLTAGFSVSRAPFTYLAPKLKYCFNPDGKYKVAINAQLIQIISNYDSYKANFSYLQVLVTKGNLEKNITVGAGKAITNTWIKINYFFTFAAKTKISNRVSFITDNNLIFGGDGNNSAIMFSGGVRVNGKNHAFDFGVFTAPMTTKFDGGFLPIPLISYSLKLNKQQK